ncbi:MAG: hypothetical protein LBL13_13190 [Bacteroidales bacterium]|jgi:hypothetical protein|nr:hypothetical protein [Bacteroidales bacterium]
MKGLEVTFRGKTILGAIEGNDIIDVHVEKVNDHNMNYILFRFGGLKAGEDKSMHYTLDYAEDLKTGDEIVIKKKEIDRESEPVYTENMMKSSEYPSDPDEKAKMLQDMLGRFRELERKLSKGEESSGV